MRTHLLYVLVLLAAGSVSAQIKPVDDKSVIGFSIKNLGIRVSGAFKGIGGNIHFDPAHPDQASFGISLDAGSVNTDNTWRDDHLRTESYLDIKHYPKIRFVSTGVVPSSKSGTWLLSGKLTIKGHTKDISFPFSATPVVGGYLFKGAFRINRKEFDVGGTSTIADEMDVLLSVLAN